MLPEPCFFSSLLTGPWPLPPYDTWVMASYPVCYLSHDSSLVCYLGHGLFPLCYLGHGLSFLCFQLTASLLSAVVRPIHLCVSGCWWMLKFSLRVFASFPFCYLDHGFFSFLLVPVSRPLPSLQPWIAASRRGHAQSLCLQPGLRPLLSLSVTGSWPLQYLSHGFFILSAVCYMGCGLFFLCLSLGFGLFILSAVCYMGCGLFFLCLSLGFGLFILSAVCYLGCSLFILSAVWVLASSSCLQSATCVLASSSCLQSATLVWPLHPVCSLGFGLFILSGVCYLG
jgi:hypothetical protein